MAARTNAVSNSKTYTTKTPAQATKEAAKRAAAPTRSEAFTDEWQTKLVESKLNDQVIREELRDRHLDTKGTSFALAKRLERHICTNIEGGAQVVACDVCKGRSLSTMRRCPFCGSEEEVVLDQAKGEVLAPAKAEPSPVEAAPSSPDDDLVTTHMAHPTDLFDPDAGTFVPAGAATSTAIVPVVVEPVAEVLPDLRGLQPSVDEAQDIARRVARVRELAVSFVVTGWDLGAELNQIRNGKLWLNLRTELGAAKYSSFRAFLEGECHFSATWAYNLMSVAEAFTRDQAMVHGIKKHILLLSVSKDVQARISGDPDLMALPERTLRDVVSEVKAGASLPTAVTNVTRRDIVAAPLPVAEEPDVAEADVTTPAEEDAPVAAPKPSPAPSKKPAPTPTPLSAPKPEPEPPTVGEVLGPAPKPQQTVTVVTMPGKFQVKLFAFQKKSALTGKRRAHRIEDLPRGEYSFSPGGQILRVSVQRGDHGLFLACEISPPPGEMR